MTQIETGSRLSLEEMRELNRRYVFFSWSIQNEVEAITKKTGKGVYFWDANGKRYLDFSSQLMNLNIGYQHPKVVAAIQAQAARLCAAHPSMVHEPKGMLGRRIAELAPGNLNKGFFTLWGG